MRLPKDIKVGQMTLEEILTEHKKWVYGKEGKRSKS